MKKLIAPVLLICCGQLGAATFCISTSAQLSAALANAETNNQSDEIRIRSGIFSAPAGSFVYNPELSDTNDSVTIGGGWTGSGNTCVARDRAPGATVLSGGGVRRIMIVENSESAVHTIALDTLTFSDGAAIAASGDSANRASLAIIQAAAGATIRVENCVFRSNVANLGLAGPFIVGKGSVIFRNNLIADNEVASGSHSAIEIGATGTAYIQNNTFADNGALDTQVFGGMHARLFQGGDAYVENNVVWGTYGGATIGGKSLGFMFDEIGGSGGFLAVRNNNFDKTFQQPAGAVATTSVDPKFVDNLNYELDGSSPLVSAGVNNAHAPGGLGNYDVMGRARLNGVTVDVGASEVHTLIFGNGME